MEQIAENSGAKAFCDTNNFINPVWEPGENGSSY